ncbi:MAG: hypothetical protein ACI4U3_05650 [Traorella sp.]
MRIKLYILISLLSCALFILFVMIGNKTGSFTLPDQLNSSGIVLENHLE